MESLQSWERQLDESARAYAAFALYRDLGPRRSVFEAYRSLRPNCGKRVSGQWNAWSVQHDWVRRAEEYDVQQERVIREAREAKRRKLAEAREDFEFKIQTDLEDRIRRLGEKLDKVLELPNTDVRLARYNDKGEVIEEREVTGIRLTEIVALSREWREAVAQAVNGHVRVTKTGRLPEANGGSGPTERLAVGLVWEKWPEGQEPAGDGEPIERPGRCW